jgi:hypothetical protein
MAISYKKASRLVSLGAHTSVFEPDPYFILQAES